MDLDYEIALNAGAYIFLAAGLLKWRRQKLPRLVDSETAYSLLETNIKRAFPELGDGFTLREGVSKARGLGADLEWDSIDRDMTSYEAFRFGGGPAPTPPGAEFLRLLNLLRRRR